MQYKTIVLRLLEDRPKLYEQLRCQRLLMQALEQHARELKASHEAWQATLTSNAALEMALQELLEYLPPESAVAS